MSVVLRARPLDTSVQLHAPIKTSTVYHLHTAVDARWHSGGVGKDGGGNWPSVDKRLEGVLPEQLVEFRLSEQPAG